MIPGGLGNESECLLFHAAQSVLTLLCGRSDGRGKRVGEEGGGPFLGTPVLCGVQRAACSPRSLCSCSMMRCDYMRFGVLG